MKTILDFLIIVLFGAGAYFLLIQGNDFYGVVAIGAAGVLSVVAFLTDVKGR